MAAEKSLIEKQEFMVGGGICFHKQLPSARKSFYDAGDQTGHT